MPSLEPLEARRLRTSSAADLSFGGDHGTVHLPGTDVHATAVLGVGGGVFVAYRDGDTNLYLEKLDYGGRPDPGFGVGGRARLTTQFTTQALGYDRRTGMVYSASAWEPGDGRSQGFQLERFDKNGRLDTAYGDDGIASYKATLGSDQVVSSTVRRLYPLPHGRVLVGLQTQFTLGSGPNAPLDREVTLLQYRNNGKRDPAFGRRGLRTVLTGAATDPTPTASGARTLTYDAPVLDDLQLLDDGGYRVLATRSRGSMAYASSADAAPDRNSEASVESRVLSSAGTLRSKYDRTWVLGTTTPADAVDGDPRELTPITVAGFGSGSAIAFATRQTGVLLAYRLSPNASPKVTTVRLSNAGGAYDPSRQIQVLPDGNGYFVRNGTATVERLKLDLTHDPKFGDAGVTTDTFSTVEYPTYSVDTQGGLLELTTSSVRRLVADDD